jgi:hypothetical protein
MQCRNPNTPNVVVITVKNQNLINYYISLALFRGHSHTLSLHCAPTHTVFIHSSKNKDCLFHRFMFHHICLLLSSLCVTHHHKTFSSNKIQQWCSFRQKLFIINSRKTWMLCATLISHTHWTMFQAMVIMCIIILSCGTFFVFTSLILVII